MTLYESFRDKMKYNQHCLILAVFKRWLEVEKSWKNVLRVNWVGSHFNFFLNIYVQVSIYTYVWKNTQPIYTYSFEKKNYINLFIIITMNKKKATVPTKLKTDYADIAATGTCHR